MHFVIKVNIEPVFTINFIYPYSVYIYYDYCIKQSIQIKQVINIHYISIYKKFVPVAIFSAAAFFQNCTNCTIYTNTLTQNHIYNTILYNI